jgi:pyruvate dehydrogenase E2 component (dihydrolipoamide acetyltransferase)
LLSYSDILEYIKAKQLKRIDPSTVFPQFDAAHSPSLAASKPGKATPAPQAATYTDIPLSNMRKVIAKRLTESKVSMKMK